MKPARRPASSRRYDVDAAFMLFQRHEGGIHALWAPTLAADSGTDGGEVTEVRFAPNVAPAAPGQITVLPRGMSYRTDK
jgi:hypothetical protein